MNWHIRCRACSFADSPHILGSVVSVVSGSRTGFLSDCLIVVGSSVHTCLVVVGLGTQRRATLDAVCHVGQDKEPAARAVTKAVCILGFVGNDKSALAVTGIRVGRCERYKPMAFDSGVAIA